MQLEKNDIGENEIGENKHLGNNPWVGNNSSIMSSLLKKKFQDFQGPYQFPRTFQIWIFFNKFKDFPGFSRTVGTLTLYIYIRGVDQIGCL